MTKYEIDIPDYDKAKGMNYVWEDGFVISAELSNEGVIIKANKAGLISLAKQLLTLANIEEGRTTHLHYDDINSLEDDSIELVIEKLTE